MKIGMIGSGMIARAVAELALKKGHEVMFSNSRGPETLFTLRRTLGCQAGNVEQAIEFSEIVMIATPFNAYKSLPVALLQDKTIMDANNYYPERDGNITVLDNKQITTSEILANHLQSSHVVKAFNAIAATEVHLAGNLENNDKVRALPISGDNLSDKLKVSEFINSLGFEVVDVGGLQESWRFEEGTPAYCVPLDSAALRDLLNKAKRTS